MQIEKESIANCKILVVGAGGAGGNSLNNLIRNGTAKIDHDANGEKAAIIEFLAVNTDNQALNQSLLPADRRILLGREGVTRGLGAGSDPLKAKLAAEESLPEFIKNIEEVDMVIITCGMGGGTGTGCSPVLAQVAKEMGKLVIGVVTKPFAFEGPHRTRIAENGIQELYKYCDTLIITPNDNLFKVVGSKTTFIQALKIMDEILFEIVTGILSLITRVGLVNLDFADIRFGMQDKGFGNVVFFYMKGIKDDMETEMEVLMKKDDNGENNSYNKQKYLESVYKSGVESVMYKNKYIEEAMFSALSNPLLNEGFDLSTSKAAILHIMGGENLTLLNVELISRIFRDQIKSDDVQILIGATILDEFEPDELKVFIITTGLSYRENKNVENIPNNFYGKRFNEKQENKISGKNDNVINNVKSQEEILKKENDEKNIINGIHSIEKEIKKKQINSTPKKKVGFWQRIFSPKLEDINEEKYDDSSIMDFLYSDDNKED